MSSFFLFVFISLFSHSRPLISFSQKSILQYVYLEGFKGGILKFSPGEEEWHYSNKGLLTFSGHSENAENVSYLWDGESLVPKEVMLVFPYFSSNACMFANRVVFPMGVVNGMVYLCVGSERALTQFLSWM